MGNIGTADSMQQPDSSTHQVDLSTAVSEALHAAGHAAALHSMQTGQPMQSAVAMRCYTGLHPQQSPVGLQDGQMGLEYLLSAPQQARPFGICIS